MQLKKNIWITDNSDSNRRNIKGILKSMDNGNQNIYKILLNRLEERITRESNSTFFVFASQKSSFFKYFLLIAY